MKRGKQQKGFTLLEILLVIAAIGILAAIVLVAINPNKQLEAARAAKRSSDINSIVKAVQQFTIENGGAYPGGMASMIENGSRVVCKTGAEQVGGGTDCTGYADLRVLVPTYIAGIPGADSGDYIVKRTANGASGSYDSSAIWSIAGNTEPTLDLNFARDKQLVNAVTGTNPITFTRGSTGTYTGNDGLIKTAAINEPRFDHNPVTKESLGLLVEEQRTNLLLWSEGFDNASWVKFGTIPATVTANDVTAPNGTITADKINVGVAGVNQTVTVIPDVPVTLSGYIKAGTGITQVLFRDDNGAGRHIIVRLSDGAIVGVVGSVTSSRSTLIGDGWYKVTMTYTPTTNQARWMIRNDTSLENGHFFLWGAQLESGSFPTSYISTRGTAVTRNADDATITGPNFTGIGGSPNTGTLFSQGVFPFAYNNGSSSHYFSIDNNSAANELATRTTIAHTAFAGNATINSNVITNAGFGSISAGQLGSIALGYNTGDSRVAANGILGGLSNTSFSGGSFNTLRIGVNRGAQYMNGTIKRIIYWNTRLTDNTLQTITQ